MIRRRDDAIEGGTGATPAAGDSGVDVFGGAGVGSALPSLRVPGWALPLEPTADGEIPNERVRGVQDSARLVLEVSPGERRGRPGFGCAVHRMPRIESDDERHLAAALVEEALERWVPWLGVERVDVFGSKDGQIELQLGVGSRAYDLAVTHRYDRSADAFEGAS